MINIHANIDGAERTVESLPEVVEQDMSHFLILDANTISEVFLTSSGLISDGNSIDGIEVSIETEKEQIIRERFSGNQDGSKSGKIAKGKVLKAPMPGMVKAISVKVGDKVQKNTQVLVLEAMKMENSITAGFTGTVSKIYADIGALIEKNMPLVEFAME
jgi:biotin carboxyl carrier protein